MKDSMETNSSFLTLSRQICPSAILKMAYLWDLSFWMLWYVFWHSSVSFTPDIAMVAAFEGGLALRGKRRVREEGDGLHLGLLSSTGENSDDDDV